MTAQAQVPTQPTVASIRLIAVLGLIAMISGLLVVSVYEYTLPMVEENKRKMIERAVFQVIPGAVERRDFVVTDSGVYPADSAPAAGTTIHAGYDAEGKLKGVAAQAAAQGYADMIFMLYGYDPACRCITGMSVLKMAETPGLGDKIITDARFQANFDALEAKLNAAGDALANPIVTVKHGTKQHPWQIDAVSGATVSSNAVGKALNNSAQALLPRLMPHVDELTAD